MKSKYALALMSLFFAQPSYAAISQISPMWTVSSPDDQDNFLGIFCQTNDMVENLDNNNIYRQHSCSTTPHNDLFMTAFVRTLLVQTSAADFSSTLYTGSSSQCVRGDGSIGACPSSGSRTFNYPSRALNSCYQISATKDADFHYNVDVATGLSLTSGAQGTVTATSYTNSSCTTGAQAVSDGTASQTGTLIVGLGINQAISIGINGTLPAGKWIKITTANTVGTPTFTMRTVQSEVVQP